MFFDIVIAIILVIAIYSFISSQVYNRRARQSLEKLNEEIRRMIAEEKDSHYLDREDLS